jgi:hypothetical protein
MEVAMTEEVAMSNSIRRVLSCISESGKSERDIAKLYLQKYPPTLEVVLKVSRIARQKAFNEKEKEPPAPSVQWALDHLLALGHIELESKDFHLGKELEKTTEHFHLSPRGRSFLLAAYQKKAKL